MTQVVDHGTVVSVPASYGIFVTHDLINPSILAPELAIGPSN